METSGVGSGRVGVVGISLWAMDQIDLTTIHLNAILGFVLFECKGAVCWCCGLMRCLVLFCFPFHYMARVLRVATAY